MRITEVLDLAYESRVTFAAFAYALGVNGYPWISRHAFEAWMRLRRKEERHGKANA